MDRLQHLIDLRGMGRVVVRLDSFTLAAEPPHVTRGPARATIARVVDGQWTWRFDNVTLPAQVTVNGKWIVNGAVVKHGDVIECRRRSGRHIREIEGRVHLARGVIDVVLREVTPETFGERWLTWRDAPIDLATTALWRAQRWAILTGPGRRQRAIALHGSRRPLFAVPSDAAFERVIVDELAEGSQAVIERGGIATMQELIERCRQTGRFVPARLASDLVLRAHLASGEWFEPRRMWIGVDGYVVTFRGGLQQTESPRMVDALRGLLGDSRDAEIEALHAKWTREFAARVIDDGPTWFPSSVDAVLDQFCQPAPDRAEVGALVAELFPERVAAEAKFADEIANLDDDAFARLVERG